jgi:ATP-dependent protease ClpP protease subunit
MTSPNCAFMIHQGTFALPDPEPQRDATQLIKELVRLDRAYGRIIAERTGQPLKTIKKLINKSYYFDANDALKLGFATKRSK